MSKEREVGTKAAPKPSKTWADEVDEADDGGYVLAAEPIAVPEAEAEAAGPRQQDSHGYQPYGYQHTHVSADRQAPASWMQASRAGYSSSSSSYQQQPQPPVDHQQHYSGWSPAGRSCSVTVSNLPLEADQQEIAAAFRRGASVQVQHVRHRPTPAEPWVVVDLADTRDLQAALQAPPGSITLAGRPLVLHVAHTAESWHPGSQVARGPRTSDNWQSTGSSGSTVQPPTPAQHAPGSGGGSEPSEAEPQQRAQIKKPDPFGGAKPVDTAAVYLDGHPHHAAAAEARMGSLPPEPHPHLSIRDAHLASEPQALHSMTLNQDQQLIEQQQLQPPVLPRQPLPGVKLLQRPQTLQQQQQQLVQQQPMWAPQGSYLQYPPSELPMHAQQPPPMPAHRGFVHAVPAGLGAPPAVFHPGHAPPPPPPPPPPARVLPAAPAAAGVVQQVQGAEEATTAAAGPGLQGQWVYRQAAPLGFRPLAAGSSRASGTGSAGSSRRGSAAALSDIAPQELTARQDPSGLYMQAREVLPHQQAGAPAHQGMYSAAPAAGYTVAGLPAERMQAAQVVPAAAVEDDWGKVEELLKRESQQGEEQGGDVQPTEADTTQEQTAIQESWGSAPAALQTADGWGAVPSTAPDAAGADSWGAAVLAAPDEPAARSTGADSWGAAAPAAPDQSAAPSAGLESQGAVAPAAPDGPAVTSAGGDAAAGGLQSSSSGSFIGGRGRGPRGRGFGPRGSHHSASGAPGYDDSRGRGRGRGRGRRHSSGELAVGDRQHWVPQTKGANSGIAAAELADASAAASAAVADMQPAAVRADGHSSSDLSRSSSSSQRGRGPGRGVFSGDRHARRDAAASSAPGAHGRKSHDGEPTLAPAAAADADGTHSAHAAGEQDSRGQRKQQLRGRGLRGGRSSHPSSAAAAVLPSEDSWGNVQAGATEGEQLPPTHRGRGRGRGGRGATEASDAAAGGEGRGSGRGRGQRRVSADANGHAQAGPESGADVVRQQRTSKAGTVSRKPADGGGAVVQKAALNPAFEPSKGEKLYQVLSAKDKQKKQGAKLENPFDLLSQLGDD